MTLVLDGRISVRDRSARPLTTNDLLRWPSGRRPDANQLDWADDLSGDSLTNDVVRLLRTFGGVILTGPPGTSKSWYASRIALEIAGDVSRVRTVQFHPSYQYEDFVQGYVPKPDGTGFELTPKHLMEVCQAASGKEGAGQPHVLVIDELSRSDPGRVFGEALTYIEVSKRNVEFWLASGTKFDIPSNVYFIATMNPFDRGVDEVDAAFERRFAKIRMNPSEQLLDEALTRNDMDRALKDRVLLFFREVQARAIRNPLLALGHTYFFECRNDFDLRSVWEHQISFHFERVLRMDPDSLLEIQSLWDEVLLPGAHGGEVLEDQHRPRDQTDDLSD
jgi:5-methylcytosine-specific restriction protein B